MNYQEEPLTEWLLNEIKPLLFEHWEEIAVNKDKIKLDPDYDSYLYLAKTGLLKVYTVRDNGKLVGYYSTLVTPHLHYRNNTYAINDLIFLIPEFRGKLVGLKLIKFAEQELKKLGVSVIMLHTKTEHSFSTIAERLGYSCVEETYSKYIGD